MTDPTTPSVLGNALEQRLERFSALDPADRHALGRLNGASEWLTSGASLIAEGAAETSVVALLEGLACRHKDFRDGRRQIIGLVTPGEICGSHGDGSGPIDYGVTALTRVRLVKIDLPGFHRVLRECPAIATALHRARLVEQAIARAWIVNLGQRRAHERMAHLFCELAHRLSDCGLRRLDGAFSISLTQGELGSVLGLTSVHVNRVIQKLRAQSLIDFDRGVVRIHDLMKLQAIAEFNPAYLSN